MPMPSNVKASQAMPFPARAVGLACLLPFAMGALAVCLAPEIRAEAASALIVYGAIVLSFLGGVRWGFAVLEGGQASWSAYGLAAIPSLMAWIGALWGGPDGLAILALALAMWFFVEKAAPPALPLPAWYGRVRGVLTAIATLSLGLAAFSW
ncbi:DUF3429 domain-containing protein [Rhodomicrobium sp. Az07]|nr:DUF3429 domain-containing protein [Rhodomicrobium sp. Az07]